MFSKNQGFPYFCSSKSKQIQAKNVSQLGSRKDWSKPKIPVIIQLKGTRKSHFYELSRENLSYMHSKLSEEHVAKKMGRFADFIM